MSTHRQRKSGSGGRKVVPIASSRALGEVQRLREQLDALRNRHKSAAMLLSALIRRLGPQHFRLSQIEKSDPTAVEVLIDQQRGTVDVRIKGSNAEPLRQIGSVECPIDPSSTGDDAS